MTVATNTAVETTTEAPEGYISINKVLSVALAEGEKRGWCNELKDVLENQLGITVPERPDNFTVRMTVDIPAEMLDYASGKNFWAVWDIANPSEVKLNQEDHYGVSKAVYGTASAVRSLLDRATDHYDRRRDAAREILNSAKLELIRTDEK